MKCSSDLLGKTQERVSAAGLSADTPPAPLTSLYCNNSITENPSENKKEKYNVLSYNDRKRQWNAVYSIQEFVKKYGENNVLCITLSTRENIIDHKEWSRRFNSFATNILAPRFNRDWIAIDERQKRGAWHTHLIVSWGCDVRSGYIFEKGRRLRSANENLRGAWLYFQRISVAYKFGPAPYCEPIKSNAIGVGFYYGKYISKGILSRPEGDKGLRLVRYGRNSKRISPKVIEMIQAWQDKVADFVKRVGLPSVDEFKRQSRLLFGRTWGFWLRNYIVQPDLDIPWLELIDEIRMEKDGNSHLSDSMQRSLVHQINSDKLAFEPIVKTEVRNPSADSPVLMSLRQLKAWAKRQRERDTLNIPLAAE